MKKSYTVSGPFAVLDHAPGETFTAELPPEINEQALLDSGALTIGKNEETQSEKVACPACVEQELVRPPKFDDLSKLQKHYADKHPALVAPDALPATAAEKEE